jgi:hypothetical protein
MEAVHMQDAMQEKSSARIIIEHEPRVAEILINVARKIARQKRMERMKREQEQTQDAS